MYVLLVGSSLILSVRCGFIHNIFASKNFKLAFFFLLSDIVNDCIFFRYIFLCAICTSMYTIDMLCSSMVITIKIQLTFLLAHFFKGSNTIRVELQHLINKKKKNVNHCHKMNTLGKKKSFFFNKWRTFIFIHYNDIICL